MATDKKLALAAVVVSLVVLPLAWAQTAQRTATYAAGAVVVDTATLEVTPDGGCDARVCARLDGGAGLPPLADCRHVVVRRGSALNQCLAVIGLAGQGWLRGLGFAADAGGVE